MRWSPPSIENTSACSAWHSDEGCPASGEMHMDLNKALNIAARGMDVQTTRLRVIAENLANQDTTGSTPGADAYRRKTVTFENRLDQKLGTDTVRIRQLGRDGSELPQHYDPSNPAAN